jgi:hypothetical protein
VQPLNDIKVSFINTLLLENGYFKCGFQPLGDLYLVNATGDDPEDGHRRPVERLRAWPRTWVAVVEKGL